MDSWMVPVLPALWRAARLHGQLVIVKNGEYIVLRDPVSGAEPGSDVTAMVVAAATGRTLGLEQAAVVAMARDIAASVDFNALIANVRERVGGPAFDRVAPRLMPAVSTFAELRDLLEPFGAVLFERPPDSAAS